MIEIPEDPLDVLIHRFQRVVRYMALSLSNETVIMFDRMNTSNDIVTAEVEFEILDSEKRMVARQLSDLIESTHMQLYPRLLPRAIRRLARQCR